MIDLGMREGTLMQLNNLEELLAKLSRASRQNNEKNYELESKYEDDSFFPLDTPDNAPVGGRIGAAKTNYRLCAG